MEEFNQYIKSLEDRIYALENPKAPSPPPISITPPSTPVQEPDDVLFINKWDNPYRMIDIPKRPDPFDDRTTYRGSMGKVEIENGVMKLSGKNQIP